MEKLNAWMRVWPLKLIGDKRSVTAFNVWSEANFTTNECEFAVFQMAIDWQYYWLGHTLKFAISKCVLVNSLLPFSQ